MSTVIVVDCRLPTHPAAVGITLIVNVIFEEVLFAAVKLPILPVPDDAVSPIFVFEFVHE